MERDREVKIGSEVLDDFFGALSQLEGVDPQVAQVLSDLHRSGGLNRDAVLSGLEKIRAAQAEEQGPCRND
jgi:hypothetical protein